MSNQFIYVSFDADAAGRKVGQAILDDDPKELKDISDRINMGNAVVEHWAQQFNGIQYSSGGDQGIYAVSSDAIDTVDSLRKDYEFVTKGLTISVGIGNTLSESGKALLSAKFRGKNQVVNYDLSVEQDILNAKQHLENGIASLEEQKLGEAYLKKENKIMDHDHSGDDCQYCKEADAKSKKSTFDHNHTGDDCQYCKEAELAETGSHQHTDEDCPYCNEANKEGDAQPQKDIQRTSGPQSVHNFTTQNAHDYSAAGLTPPSIEKPTGNDPVFTAQGEPPAPHSGPHIEPSEVIPNENEESQAAEDNQSQEAMQAIMEAIEGQSIDGKPLKEEMENIDDAAMPVSDEMEDNISRPGKYSEENVPTDMGLGESEIPEDSSPDLNNVLRDGLDAHADNIQRDKVIELVSSALTGFKSSKQIIENAKEQAPEFYQANIAMLKAMIEMAKMLGLGLEENFSEPKEKQNPQSSQQVAPKEVATKGPKIKGR